MAKSEVKKLENIDGKLGQIHDWFEKAGKTLGFAESCTGGLLSAKLAERPGISKIFLGAVVSYHGSVKHNVLGVPMTLIQSFGEVSEAVVLEMARGVIRELKTDWAVAISGIAGPTGGTPEKPVGTVWFAVVGPGFEKAQEKRFVPKDRRKIQLDSVEFAIDFLWDSIHA